MKMKRIKTLISFVHYLNPHQDSTFPGRFFCAKSNTLIKAETQFIKMLLKRRHSADGVSPFVLQRQNSISGSFCITT